MDFKIDPVKATKKRLLGTEPRCVREGDDSRSGNAANYQLQAMNDTCYGVCAAYSDTFQGLLDSYYVNDDCAQACKDYIQQYKNDTIVLANDCYPQAPYRAAIFHDVPRYFPALLFKTKNPATALGACKQMCEGTPNHLNECKLNCQTDFDALVPVEKSTEQTVEGFSGSRTSNSNSGSRKQDSGKWRFLALLVIVIGIVLGIYFLKYKG
jgi:hypothetical protein